MKVDWEEIYREGKGVGGRAGQMGRRTDDGQCIKAKAERLDVSRGDRIGVRSGVAVEAAYPLMVVALVINASGNYGKTNVPYEAPHSEERKKGTHERISRNGRFIHDKTHEADKAKDERNEYRG